METGLDTAMSLSREIIVLDFGDEATSPYDFDRTTTRPGGNCKFKLFLCLILHVLLAVTDFKVDAVNWPGTSEQSFASSTEVDTCPTRTSGRFRDFQNCFQDIVRPSIEHIYFSAGIVRGVRLVACDLHLHDVLFLHEEGHPPEPEGARC